MKISQSLQKNQEALQAPIKLTSREDIMKELRQAVVNEKLLAQLQKQVEDLREKQKEIVLASVLDEKELLEEDLEVTRQALKNIKELEFDRLEVNVESVREISKNTFYSIQSCATLHSLSIYEYAQLMPLRAPPLLRTLQVPSSQWMDSWATSICLIRTS